MTNLSKTTNLICHLVRGPPNLRAGYFFLVEEQSDGASEAWAGVPASASLRAGAGALSKADRTNIFFGCVNVCLFHENN